MTGFRRPRAKLLGALIAVTALIVGACSSGTGSEDSGSVLGSTNQTTEVSETEPAGAVSLQRMIDTIATETSVLALGAARFDDNGLLEVVVAGVRQRGDANEAASDDSFHLGSNTEAMTAVVLARLAEQGRGISFDTTIAEAFSMIDDTHPGYADVTMMQLLTHTGGTPGEGIDIDIDDSILAMPLVEARSLAAGLLLAQAPAAMPGTISSYSTRGM